ncbi:MAG TPA: SLC13 family permease [Pirellulaceae bacterium]|nr:SLC13 family permease [Pirellulaceae bacterium]
MTFSRLLTLAQSFDLHAAIQAYEWLPPAIVIVVTCIVLAALIWDLVSADVAFLTAALTFAILGIISPTAAFDGFANPSVITVGLLFIVAAGMRETGVLDVVGAKVLGKSQSSAGALARLAFVIVPSSAFLNNTPIVAMFVPIVLEWCRRREISPSRLLIPISFMATLGGTCTLIGTSTNLLVNAEMHKREMPGIGLFEISMAGIPYAIVGVLYMLICQKALLPERKELVEQLGESRREYLVEMLVQPACRLAGQTVEDAGLRQLPGLFLIAIDRGGEAIGPVSPEDYIRANDRLIFTGVVSSIVELEKIPGLVPAVDPTYEVNPKKQVNRRLVEAVVSRMSPLTGKTIREADFRAVYGAAVVAVHRSGNRLREKLGDVSLRPGDTLLLQTDPHFERAHRNDPAFYLVSGISEWRPLRRDRAWLSIGIFVLLLLLMTTGMIPLVVAAALAAVLMILFDCISAGDARQSVEWSVLVTVAAAMGVGAAIENTGVASMIAGGLVDAALLVPTDWKPYAAVAAIYIATTILTNVITNNAAAILMFPICVAAAHQLGVDSRPLLMTLCLAASAAFATPIGYQTNMMVYGPGGYRFFDFVRFGIPLNLILGVLATALVPIVWPFEAESAPDATIVSPPAAVASETPGANADATSDDAASED